MLKPKRLLVFREIYDIVVDIEEIHQHSKNGSVLKSIHKIDGQFMFQEDVVMHFLL